MEGRINDLDIIRHLLDDLRVNDLLLDLLHIGVVDLLADNIVKAGLLSLFFIHCLSIAVFFNSWYFIYDICISRRCYLCAILPIYLVAVILRRIVTCSNNNTCCTMELSYSIWKLWCRSEWIKNICLDTISIKTESSNTCELRWHSAAVIGNCNTLILCTLFQNVVCKALCCLSYSIDIHAVRACTYHTSKSACTKLKILIESVLYLRLVWFNSLEFCFCLIIKIWICKPVLIFLHKIFHYITSSYYAAIQYIPLHFSDNVIYLNTLK